MVEDLLTLDYTFESSWEVYSKVGGIYAVLSTRANTLQEKFRDRIFLIGPDVWQGKESPLLIESDNLRAAWKEHMLEKDELSVRARQWNIPGKPIIIPVDFQPFPEKKNDIYTEMWNRYQVDSLHIYGDCDEASIFSYAAGRVVESFYRYNLVKTDRVVCQAHEQVIGIGALYVQEAVPEVATIFTTHVMFISHSIVGNNKPLYDYLFAYSDDQMAQELNMQSKHSIRKQTAHYVDCFITVSEMTNNECKELLNKLAGVVLMDGFEGDFVPKGGMFAGKRKCARTLTLSVANKLLGTNLGDDTLIAGASGRYESRNKGTDVFLESLSRLNRDKKLYKNVLVFINIPGQVGEPCEDLQAHLKGKDKFGTSLEVPFTTYRLHNMTHDQVLDMSKYLGIGNRPEDKVKVTSVPRYLDGRGGIMNREYYDILLGQDLSVYASYYEPWGYTPLGSVTFHIPTITADLTRFGLWVNSLKNQHGINGGVEVLRHSDYNYPEVADGIEDTITSFANKTGKEVKEVHKCVAEVVGQALWRHSTQYYYEAYDVALCKAKIRRLS